MWAFVQVCVCVRMVTCNNFEWHLRLRRATLKSLFAGLSHDRLMIMCANAVKSPKEMALR